MSGAVASQAVGEPMIGSDESRIAPRILQGDVLDLLARFPDGYFHTCATSPPYWGLRRYDICPCSVERKIVSEFHTRPTTPTDAGGGVLHNVPRKPDPKCRWCHGTGRIPEVSRGRVWGGAPGCKHRWSSLKPRRTRKAADATSEFEKSHVGANYDSEGSSTCSKCGAWRGLLGNEPIHDCLAWARAEPPCPVCFVCHIRTIAAGVWRVLRDDGTFWVNLGDTYSTHPAGLTGAKRWKASTLSNRDQSGAEQAGSIDKRVPGLKEKDLAGIPWRVALALQADGWGLRSDPIDATADDDTPPVVIWEKPNPMPESMRDRPTRSHEYIFMLTKQARYFYDQDGFREPHARLWDESNGGSFVSGRNEAKYNRETYHAGPYPLPNPAGRNLRSVWRISTKPYPEAHFATFPTEIPERIIRLSTSERGVCGMCGAPMRRKTERTTKAPYVAPSEMDRYGNGEAGVHRKIGAEYNEFLLKNPKMTVGWARSCPHGKARIVPARVLDIFAGSGTTVAVARELNRQGWGFELNPVYVELAKDRCAKVAERLYPRAVAQLKLGEFGGEAGGDGD